jgi:hypothetical protein
MSKISSKQRYQAFKEWVQFMKIKPKKRVTNDQ